MMLLPINHYVTYNGEWDFDALRELLPANILQAITTASPPSALHHEDDFKWGVTPDGVFTTKSAYATIAGFSNITTQPIFQVIWKWQGAERIKILLWKLGHGSLMTNMERKRRKMTTDSICPICNEANETLFHCFRDCRKSFSLWMSFKVRNLSQFYSNQDWRNWIESNLFKRVNSNKEAH